jgi:hypothetical protein
MPRELHGAPRFLRRAVELAARVPSGRLGKTLARFDARIGEAGLRTAARDVLHAFGARVAVNGTVPASGGALLVANHPGAYDALAMMASLDRENVAIIASERAFLRAMPHLCKHLVFVTDSRTDASTSGRAMGLRRALAWLEQGRVLVQFGAGAIEPDARFLRKGDEMLGPWQEGTGVLASRAAALGAAIVPVFVSGVHSRRAKSLPFIGWAERRGITTIAPLLQATLPGFRDVSISVALGAPVDRALLASASSRADRTRIVRDAVGSLVGSLSSARG